MTNIIKTIQLWGDSVGKGIVYDSERKRYVLSRERFDLQLQRTLGLTIENHSQMGATVGDGLQEYVNAGSAESTIVFIEYGGNDCNLNWAEVAAEPQRFHDGKTPLAEFRNLLGRFVSEVRLRGGEPVLVTPPPLHAQRFFDWVTKGLDMSAVMRYLRDVQTIYRWQERYSNAVRDTAYLEGCGLFDLRDVFLALPEYGNYICEDGMHPNSSGYALITEIILTRDKRYFKAFHLEAALQTT